MSENKEKKKKPCNFKCSTCHNYDKDVDYCYYKEIAECSKQIYTDFSICDSYLIREDLVMF